MNPTEVHRQWASRSGEYSPEYYAYYGSDQRSEWVHDVLDRHLDRDASILELGCSSGRHLAYLYEHGFENPSGIDINDEAFDVMAEVYPELADAGTFHRGSIEDVIGDFEDDRFDAVYSVETLQHLHPDSEWVLEEICRIMDDLLITVENEGGDGNDDESEGQDGDGHESRSSSEPEVNYVNDDFPLYYRDWNRVFTEFGLTEIEVRSDGRDTRRAFRTSE